MRPYPITTPVCGRCGGMYLWYTEANRRRLGMTHHRVCCCGEGKFKTCYVTTDPTMAILSVGATTILVPNDQSGHFAPTDTFTVNEDAGDKVYTVAVGGSTFDSGTNRTTINTTAAVTARTVHRIQEYGDNINTNRDEGVVGINGGHYGFISATVDPALETQDLDESCGSGIGTTDLHTGCTICIYGSQVQVVLSGITLNTQPSACSSPVNCYMRDNTSISINGTYTLDKEGGVNPNYSKTFTGVNPAVSDVWMTPQSCCTDPATVSTFADLNIRVTYNRQTGRVATVIATAQNPDNGEGSGCGANTVFNYVASGSAAEFTGDSLPGDASPGICDSGKGGTAVVTKL